MDFERLFFLREEQELYQTDMANILNTISYEVLCLIGRRAPRVYIKDNEVLGIRYLM